MIDQQTYKIAFASIRGMGVDLAGRLLEVVHSEEEFFGMSEKDLRALTGSRTAMCRHDYRRQLLEKAGREQEFIGSKNVTMSYFTDPDFPRRLLEAPDAPIMLYKSGDCDLNRSHIIGMVGTRHATAQGIKMCDELVGDFARQLDDVVIVSGLAYGIDIASHRAAIKHGIPTVAVMAQGLNKIYPSAHRNDAVNIIRQGGAVVTEYQSQDQLHKGNFLARNRIIAALCDCTIVVESASTGGALVTASLAQSYNRDVMAVPGRLTDEYSRGCNKLIRDNRAMLITCAADVVQAMRWQAREPVTSAVQATLFPELTKEEATIMSAIRTHENIHINDLANEVQIPIYKLMGALVELDCRGLIVTLPGCRYATR